MPGALDSAIPAGLSPQLLSAQNLVNANAPAVMTPSAIQAMTDSMRSGALTAQDVIDRVGELGKTTRKAQIELHKREIADLQDPELTSARHAMILAGANAQTAQSNLGGTQAQAAQTLVPAQTQIQAGQLAQGLNEMATGIPGAAVRQLNLIYNLGAEFDPQTGVLKNPETVLPGLSHVMGATNAMQMSKALGEQIETVKQTDKDGNVADVPAWKSTHQPLSPEYKSLLNRYQGMTAPLFPGGPAVPVQPNAPATAPAKPDIAVPPPDAATLPPVGNGPPVDANGNLITAVRTDADKAKQAAEFAESARKNGAVESWRKAQPFYALAENAIHAINQTSKEEQNRGSTNLNQRDFELADAVVKMLDPEGTVREFKWEKLANGQPRYPDQVHAVMARLTGQGTFVPGVRQELMKVANDAIRAREKTAADVLQGAGAIGGSMTPLEKGLISGNFTPSYSPPGDNQNQPAAGAQVITGTSKLTGRKGVSTDGGKTWKWVN